MLEVIIGKEGTQRFAINGSRVSRQHAKITVTDSGQWILEDLNSTNGTYIINENDELVQIKRVNITEFTRIVLADQTSMGFTFYAHHVLEEDPKNYQQEFRYVLEIHHRPFGRPGHFALSFLPASSQSAADTDLRYHARTDR